MVASVFVIPQDIAMHRREKRAPSYANFVTGISLTVILDFS